MLKGLDTRPPTLLIGLGLTFGGLLGWTLLSELPPVVATAAFLAALGGALALASTGELVLVEARPLPETPSGRLLPEPPHPVTPRELWLELPAGVFLMGSPKDEEGRLDREGPRHEVSISAFEMMRVPVTRGLYRQLVGDDPGWPDEADSGAVEEVPVNNVSWHDAVRFCNKLSKAEGLAPCYEIDGSKVAWTPAADGYRLPTEAEWEYACRAGTQTPFCHGDSEEDLEKVAWFSANSGGRPHAAGSKAPNAWGLHDMHGNVWEWCFDGFREYSEEKLGDPVGPSPALGSAAVRGGSYLSSPRSVRSAYRLRFRLEDRGRDLGFRCVRGPRPQLESSIS